MVQVMFAISAAAGMGYYMMSEQQNQNKINSKSNAQEVVDTASAIIKTSLASSAFCTLNLANKQTNDPVPLLLTSTSDVVASANQNLTGFAQGFKLERMDIKSYKEPVSGEVADYLYVIYNIDPLNVKKLVGSKTISKKFRLRGKKLLGRYVFCYHEESNMVELSAKRNCEEMRGVWNNWDCNVDVNQFVDSTPSRCPAGKLQLAVPASQVKTNCTP